MFRDPSRRSFLAAASGSTVLTLLPGAGIAQDAKPLDPQSAAVNAIVAGPDVRPLHMLSVRELREEIEAAGRSLQTERAPVARVEDTDVPLSENQTPIRLYYPADVEEETPPIIVYCHGGSFIAGSIESHDHVARLLSQSCGAVVASVGYRLAPENPYPAALDDVTEALEWIVDKAGALGADPTRIGLVGDGAGGTLAAGTAVRRRRANYEGLRFLGLITPYLQLDDTVPFPSRREFGFGGYRPSLKDLTHMRETYLNLEEDEAPSTQVSPLDASRFDGLPSTLVITAGYDMARDEGGFFVRRLRENGVLAGERRFETTIHNFAFYAPIIPAGRLAFDVIGAQFRRAIGQDQTSP